ncbi:MAG: hypothetical protein JSR91_05145 [Proteobacteria bacterium]|nr:hypothetical protein [Pseudomonadota bacterium]
MKSTVVLLCSMLAVLGPSAAFAQSADAKYCDALSHQYNKYVLASEGKSHNTAPSNVSAAMGKCSTDAKTAIPILEKALQDAKVSLPPRT